MEKQIWKFEITTNKFTLEMPKWAKILSVQAQGETPCIWALVDPKMSKEARYFEVFGTGHDIRCDIGIVRKYIGTFQLNGSRFVFHLFERIS